MITIILVSTFVSIAFIVMAVYWLMFRPASATAQRLRDLDDPRGGVAVQSIEPNSMESLAACMAEPLNRLVPPSAKDAKKLRKKLMQAGFRAESAPGIYRAIQLTLMIAFPSMVLFGYSFTAQPMSEALLPCLGAFATGFLKPRFIL